MRVFNVSQKNDEYQKTLAELNISKEPLLSVEEFYQQIHKIFNDCIDFTYRKVVLFNGKIIYLYYLQALINEELLQEGVVKPLIKLHDEAQIKEFQQHIYSIQNEELTKWPEIIYSLFSGGVICHNGGEYPIDVSLTGQDKRAISDPTTEYQVFGPKVGFIEDITTNIGIMRKLIKDPRLKAKSFEVGTVTHTKTSLMYLDDLVDHEYLQYLEQKINDIDLEYLLNIGELNKNIIDAPFSVFPQVLLTERPDKAAYAMTEGKILILMEGSTFCSILPVGLLDFYITSGDYSFSSFWNLSFIRLIRYASMILSTALPALYVALIAFHPELIPTTLILTIIESRMNIPFPAVAEALIMMFALDVLVEASIRLPSFVGQTIGIVGGLVIGTAAVEAGVISSLMVIIIAFTAIASFTAPAWELVSALRVIRYGLLVISAMYGLYGFVLGFCLIFIHICNIETIPRVYIEPFSKAKKEQLKKSLRKKLNF
ncbi:spore germination protein [Bacillaceae bacterium IKA-2]|nr:spore germination protein [Bacillaceae bacterium IKA-2]